MYPSDYGYAAGETCATEADLYNFARTSSCTNISWLLYTSDDQWLLTPSSYDNFVFYTFSNGNVENSNPNTGLLFYGFSVRPVFYLKPEVIITGGTGTIDSPYTLFL